MHQKFVSHRPESPERRRLVELAGLGARLPVGGGKHHKHDGGDEVGLRGGQIDVKNPTISGIAMIRVQVIKVGMVQNIPILA
jgi:hypothetical protein